MTIGDVMTRFVVLIVALALAGEARAYSGGEVQDFVAHHSAAELAALARSLPSEPGIARCKAILACLQHPADRAKIDCGVLNLKSGGATREASRRTRKPLHAPLPTPRPPAAPAVDSDHGRPVAPEALTEQPRVVEPAPEPPIIPPSPSPTSRSADERFAPIGPQAPSIESPAGAACPLPDHGSADDLYGRQQLAPGRPGDAEPVSQPVPPPQAAEPERTSEMNLPDVWWLKLAGVGGLMYLTWMVARHGLPWVWAKVKSIVSSGKEDFEAIIAAGKADVLLIEQRVAAIEQHLGLKPPAAFAPPARPGA
jgi:hypothetical protein